MADCLDATASGASGTCGGASAGSGKRKRSDSSAGLGQNAAFAVQAAHALDAVTGAHSRWSVQLFLHYVYGCPPSTIVHGCLTPEVPRSLVELCECLGALPVLLRQVDVGLCALLCQRPSWGGRHLLLLADRHRESLPLLYDAAMKAVLDSALGAARGLDTVHGLEQWQQIVLGAGGQLSAATLLTLATALVQSVHATLAKIPSASDKTLRAPPNLCLSVGRSSKSEFTVRQARVPQLSLVGSLGPHSHPSWLTPCSGAGSSSPTLPPTRISVALPLLFLWGAPPGESAGLCCPAAAPSR